MQSLRTHFRSQGAQVLGVAAALWVAGGLLATARAQEPEPVQGFISDDYFWVQFPTQPGYLYHVEISDDLTTWDSLVANLPGSGTPLAVLDPDSGLAHAARFYRVGRYPGALPGEPAGNPDPARYAWITAGTFTMGSPAGSASAEADEAPPTVTQLTRGFWMGRQEVTQEQYLALTGSNPSSFSADVRRPVENVGFSDATNYCALLTLREQQAGRLPVGYAYRLPTEAEWEYACRAGSTGAFCFGEDPDGGRLGYYASDFDTCGSTNQPAGFSYLLNGNYYTTQPSGVRQPSAWGLYDVHGNVWEWCLDWYATSYAYPGRTPADPTGPASGTARVIRGGSWNSGPPSCRSANRSAAMPDGRSDGIGFRVVLAPLP